MTTKVKSWSGWQDSIELVIGLWLIASPFVLGFIESAPAAMSAICVGAMVFLFSQLGIAEQRPWEEWTNLTLALLLIISPWVLGYAAMTSAMINASACGATITLLAIITMNKEYDQIKGMPTI